MGGSVGGAPNAQKAFVQTVLGFCMAPYWSGAFYQSEHSNFITIQSGQQDAFVQSSSHWSESSDNFWLDCQDATGNCQDNAETEELFRITLKG